VVWCGVRQCRNRSRSLVVWYGVVVVVWGGGAVVWCGGGVVEGGQWVNRSRLPVLVWCVVMWCGGGGGVIEGECGLQAVQEPVAVAWWCGMVWCDVV